MAFPATFLDLQEAVIAKVNLDATNDRQKVKDWINHAYAQACEDTDANLVVDTMALTAGQFRYVLPTSICRIDQMYVTALGATTPSEPLELTTLDDLMRKRACGPATGSATHYALGGLSVFEVFPTPSAADVLTLYMSEFPVPLVNNGDVAVLQEPFGSRLLELGALVQAAEFKGDQQGAMWKAQHDEWMRKFTQHLEARAGSRPAHGHQWAANRAC